MVEHLINPVERFWNVALLNAYIHPDDVKIIRGLAVSRCQRPDMYGWNYTNLVNIRLNQGSEWSLYTWIELQGK